MGLKGDEIVSVSLVGKFWKLLTYRLVHGNLRHPRAYLLSSADGRAKTHKDSDELWMPPKGNELLVGLSRTAIGFVAGATKQAPNFHKLVCIAGEAYIY